MSTKKKSIKISDYVDSDDDAPKEIDEKDIEKFDLELDQVYEMLNRLTSKDENVADSAKDDIDVYLERRQRQQAEEEEKKKITAGCKVTASKTVINNKVKYFDFRWPNYFLHSEYSNKVATFHLSI